MYTAGVDMHTAAGAENFMQFSVYEVHRVHSPVQTLFTENSSADRSDRVYTNGDDAHLVRALPQVGSHDAMPPLDFHRGSGQPMGRLSVGRWHQISGTLLG